MRINADYSDLLLSLNNANVKYLIVGAYAIEMHIKPRRNVSPRVAPPDDPGPAVNRRLRLLEGDPQAALLQLDIQSLR